jgi:hypothetical protein
MAFSMTISMNDWGINRHVFSYTVSQGNHSNIPMVENIDHATFKSQYVRQLMLLWIVDPSFEAQFFIRIGKYVIQNEFI